MSQQKVLPTQIPYMQKVLGQLLAANNQDAFDTAINSCQLEDAQQLNQQFAQALNEFRAASLTLLPNGIPIARKEYEALCAIAELNNLDSQDLMDAVLMESQGRAYLLRFRNLHFKDLSPLKYFETLKSFELEFCSAVQLTQLQELTELETLRFDGVRMARQDFSFLKGLAHLQSIHLNNLSNFNVTCLRHATSLLRLNLNSNKLTELEGIAAHPNLTKLSLSDNELEDIKDLKTLAELKELDLANNYRLPNLEAITGLTKLEKLDLENTGITDISNLEALVNLKELNLCNNPITDLEPLLSLQNLLELKVDEQDLKNQKALAELKALMASNQLKKMRAIRQRLHLQKTTRVDS